MNIKNIHIGSLIKQRIIDLDIDKHRVCSFLNISESELEMIFITDKIDSDRLLKLSKLLKYDFFRLYSQHLILYSPECNQKTNIKKSTLPIFRKNIYSKEIIDFILKKIASGHMTKIEVINRYNIPKTTLYKWIEKYS
nr:transposase [Chryseobacterium sp.]